VARASAARYRLRVHDIGRAVALHGSRAVDAGTRVVRDGASTLLLLANGSECGWSTGSSRIARLLLDRVVTKWRRGMGDPASRLSAAITDAQQPFLKDAASLLPTDDPDIVGGPGGEILGVSLAGNEAHLAWIGGAEALLLRGGAVLAQTHGHTLWRQWLAAGQPAVENLPDIVVRHICDVGQAGHDPPEEAYWELGADDTVVMMSRGALRAVDATAVVDALQRRGSSMACANALADEALRHESGPQVGVVVLRRRG
jgi:serine/threonine protein phosphatase PrpC